MSYIEWITYSKMQLKAYEYGEINSIRIDNEISKEKIMQINLKYMSLVSIWLRRSTQEEVINKYYKDYANEYIQLLSMKNYNKCPFCNESCQRPWCSYATNKVKSNG